MIVAGSPRGLKVSSLTTSEISVKICGSRDMMSYGDVVAIRGGGNP
jgi:hypothetical protein